VAERLSRGFSSLIPSHPIACSLFSAAVFLCCFVEKRASNHTFCVGVIFTRYGNLKLNALVGARSLIIRQPQKQANGRFWK
jgi:hypothetical protein